MHTHSMYVRILFRAMGMAHHTSVSHSIFMCDTEPYLGNETVCECCSFALHRQSLCESGVAHFCKRVVARIRWQVFVDHCVVYRLINVRGHVLTKSICLVFSFGAQDDVGVHEGKLAHQQWWVPSGHSPLLCGHTYICVHVSEVRGGMGVKWGGRKRK